MKKIHIIGIVLLVIIAVYSIFFVKREYELETVESYVNESNERENFVYIGESFYKYNKNGVVKFGSSFKNVKWNSSFFLSNPILKNEKNIFAITENRGHQCYVYSEDGLMYEVKSENPIVDYEINSKGYLALIFETKDGYEVPVYNDRGKEIIRHVSYRENDGYPFDLDISEDGRILAMSFVDISGNEVNNKVSQYYIDSADGKDFINSMFYSKHYDFIIPKIKFVENRLIGVAEDKIIFYDEDGEYETIDLKANIFKFKFLKDGKFALMFSNEMLKSEEKTVLFYNEKGKKISEYKNENLNADFFDSDEENIYISDGKKYTCFDYKGKMKWEDTFDKDIVKIYQMKKNKYIMVNLTGVEIMEVKRK